MSNNPNSHNFAAHELTYRDEEGEIVVAYKSPNHPKYQGIDTEPAHDFSELDQEAASDVGVTALHGSKFELPQNIQEAIDRSRRRGPVGSSRQYRGESAAYTQSRKDILG